jgi:DNA repair protein RadC
MPAYGVADGVQSWRYNLKARERAVVDRALALLGGILREPDGVFTSPDAAKDYLSLQLGADPCERFSVLYLNCQHRTIAYECHFSGTLTQTSVYPREIVTAALKHQASAVVLAHNHPSGSVEPSNADVALTQSMKHALALVDVRVLDHIIVGRRAAFSFIENGLL